ncbi:ABC-type transport auxiliary lipoprotein family protein [Marinicella sp. W31]|uniref:ABC-type transport auxiliary lipoprotein family protein n=1 Tax=Marinicella sp. W31 TaxID=3023713 RepID=UPI003757A8AB
MTVLCTACASTSSPVRMHYRLQPTEFSSTQQHSSTVLIPEPKARGILGNRPMVATDANGALVQLDYNFWLESPRKLLHETITQWAEQRFKEVMPGRAYKKENLRLESEITAFEKKQNQAVVGIKFLLKDASGNTLLRKTYQHNQALSGEGYADFANGISEAIRLILSNLEQDINACCSPKDS